MCPIDSDLKERTVMQRLILGMVEIHGNSEMMWFRPIFKDQIKHQKKKRVACVPGASLGILRIHWFH
jgi:hypothetical protein